MRVPVLDFQKKSCSLSTRVQYFEPRTHQARSSAVLVLVCIAGMISLVSSDNKNERKQALVITAHEIGCFVRELSKNYIPNPLCPDFLLGPNFIDWQTEKGLILTVLYEIKNFHPQKDVVIGVYIDTPYGPWKVLWWPQGISDQEWQQLFGVLKGQLDLEILPEEKTRFGRGGSSYAITRWKNRRIEKPVYRDPSAAFARLGKKYA